MTILVDAWIPDGGPSRTSAAAKFAVNDYVSTPSTGQITPAEVPGSLDLVLDPLGGPGWCARTSLSQADIDAHYPNAAKTVLFPVTPSNSDPIVDWGAPYAAVRRWYRFAVMVTSWQEEPRVVGYAKNPESQLTVVWQLHDAADTTPADTYWEPPLWLIDDGAGGWSLRNAYDVNTLTGAGTVVRRELCRVPRVLNQWQEFVIYMKPSWTSGFMQVWLNGRRIFVESGVPNCFNHDPVRGGTYNFIEYGIYGAKSQQVTPHTVYHKGMQIGDEAYTTFDAFMAACGSSNREVSGFFSGAVSLGV